MTAHWSDTDREEDVQALAVLGAVAGSVALGAMAFFRKEPTFLGFAAKSIGVGLAAAGVVFAGAVLVAELVIAGEDI